MRARDLLASNRELVIATLKNLNQPYFTTMAQLEIGDSPEKVEKCSYGALVELNSNQNNLMCQPLIKTPILGGLLL